MLNYISAELWRMVRKWRGVLLTAAFLLLVAVYAVACIGATRSGYLKLYGGMLVVGFYMMVPIAALADDSVTGTGMLKNEVSFGFSRGQIYFGKLTASFLAGVALFALATALYLALAMAMGEREAPEVEAAAWIWMAEQLEHVFPRWVGALCLAHALYFISRNGGIAASLYYLYLVFGELFLSAVSIEGMGALGETLQAAIEAVRPILLSGDFWVGAQSWADLIGPLDHWLAGGLWVAVTSAVGLMVFKRREIN